MKGIVKLELIDKKGNVETILDHNYQTDALDKIMAQGGESNPSFLNSYAGGDRLNMLLGGVMLFDDAIETQGVTDDPTIIEAPLGLHMVANGVKGMTNTDNPTELGSYNTAESGWSNDGETLTMICDWTLSQGNGTINSVCLTSDFYAREGLGNGSATSRSNSGSVASYNPSMSTGRYSQYRMFFGMYDDMLYTLDIGSVGYKYKDISNATELVINKESFCLSDVEYRASNTSPYSYGTMTVALPQTLQNVQSLYIIRVFQKGSNLYFLTSPSPTTFAIDSTYNVCKLNLATNEITVIASIVPSTFGATAAATSYTTLDSGMIGFSDKYFLFGSIVIDYVNSKADDVDNLPDYSSSGDIYFVRQIAGRFYVGFYQSYSQYWITGVIDPKNAEYFPVNYSNQKNVNACTYCGYKDNALLPFVEDMGIYRNPRYLGTIFNLSQPVTKTSDKAMRLTYTLDFSEEEE